LKRAVLGSDSTPFATLGDVATVLFAPEPATGGGRTIDGRHGVQLVVCRSSTVPARSRSRAGSRSRWTGCGPCWPATASSWTPRCFRPADFIDLATGNVWSALLLGAALVVAVLVLFMADWRNAAVSCAAIPLSLLATLRLPAGFRRQREHDDAGRAGGCDRRGGRRCGDRRREHPEADARQPAAGRSLCSTASVILDACLEVRSGVVYRDLRRRAGRFADRLVVGRRGGACFAPLGYAYALAIIASLLVSLTVIPALSSLLFRPPSTDARRGAAGAALVPYPLRTDAGAGHPASVAGDGGRACC